MSNAGRDQNSKTTIILASKNDGVTIVPVVAIASSHGLKAMDGTTGTDNGNNGGNAMMDENEVPVWTALSSAGDGAIIEVYGDPLTNALLLKST